MPLHHATASRGPPPRGELREDFGSAALRLAGLAGLHFGWTPAVFWDATPAELGALVTAALPAGGGGLGSAELARLMKEHPDG